MTTDNDVYPRCLKVDVRGLPRPQGSLKAVPAKHGDHIALKYPPGVYQWRAQVTQAVLDALRDGGPFTGPVELRLGFDLPRPLAHYGTGRNSGQLKPSAPEHPTCAPDVDKLARAIGDALTDAGAWADDAQVVVIHAAKRYARLPGVLITVKELPVTPP